MSKEFLRAIHVFISSPGDVKPERECVARVLERLNRMSHVRSRFQFVPLAYEEDAPALVGRPPQQVVNDYMMRANQADLFICILWQRMGTPVLDPHSGLRFQSGTEYEFTAAYQANQQLGRPFMLLYRCARPPVADADTSQLAAVEGFFQQFSGPKATWKGLFKKYRGVQEFEEILWQDLDDVINRDQLRALQPHVSLQGDLSNSGWIINFQISEPTREIFYSHGRSRPFKSTGHQAFTDPRTGFPMSTQQVILRLRRGKHLFRVKYVDVNGETKGPFDLSFDTETERMRDVRATLEQFTPDWVSFRWYDGRWLAYFTTLVSEKDTLKSVHYSINNESLSRELRFKAWRGSDSPDIDDDDETCIELPADTKYVAVQVTFRDGTRSEVKKFRRRGGPRC